MTKNDALPFPTILVIDSADREISTVALLRRDREAFIAQRAVKAQEIPQIISDVLGEVGILPAQLKALALVKRGGSVTAARIGTAAVNTLAWLERLPILEVEAQSMPAAIEALQRGRYTAAVKSSLPFA